MCKEAKVTCSTLHRAIGLGTLKEAQAHFESIYNDVEKPEPSHNQTNAMKHGRENEINAVATLVGKLLPVYNPTVVFVEEGCNQIPYANNKEAVLMAVSPDGSGFDLTRN